MPTYQFECPNCGKFEDFVSITESENMKCPKCGAQCTKLMGTPSFKISKTVNDNEAVKSFIATERSGPIKIQPK